MWRFSLVDRDKHHTTEGELLLIVEKLLPGDKMTVEKEIKSGYHVLINEVPPPKPPAEFEG